MKLTQEFQLTLLARYADPNYERTTIKHRKAKVLLKASLERLIKLSEEVESELIIEDDETTERVTTEEMISQAKKVLKDRCSTRYSFISATVDVLHMVYAMEDFLETYPYAPP